MIGTGSRKGIWLGVMTILLVSLGNQRAGSAQSQKIRISLSSRSNTNTSYYVAQAKGFFKEEGLEVEFIQINPRLGAMAVLNGDVTFTTSFVSTFRGIVQGLPMKTVLVLLNGSAVAVCRAVVGRWRALGSAQRARQSDRDASGLFRRCTIWRSPLSGTATADRTWIS